MAIKQNKDHKDQATKEHDFSAARVCAKNIEKLKLQLEVVKIKDLEDQHTQRLQSLEVMLM
jgi:hypothetical protein